MAWSTPFDEKGRLAGAKQLLTLGTGGSAYSPAVTKVSVAADPVKIKARDSGDWNNTKKRLFGTSLVLAVDTKISVEAYFVFSLMPDKLIDLLFEGGPVAVSYKPDGTNELFGGTYTMGPWNGDFPAEDFCTVTFDLDCSGDPTVGGNITVP